MKKKNLIIISVITVVVIIGLSIFYPPADETDSAGTIGKANKYRNDETGQDKIVLRNEFLQDTSALKVTIAALIQYEAFLGEINNDYSDFEKTFKELNDSELDSNLDELNSLAIYMKNNLNTVTNTRELLTEYYTKDTVDMSIDVENNLIEFGSFLVNLDKKSSVVDSLFVDLSDMLDGNKVNLLALTEEQTENLKAIREKMLAGIFVYSYLANNESKLNFALNSNIIDAMALNRALNNKLGLIVMINNKLSFIGPNNREKLGVFSEEALGLWGKEQLGFSWGKEELTAHNMEKLNGFFNEEKLGFSSGSFNREKLDNQESLGVMFSNELAASMKNKQLGSLWNNKALGIAKQGNKYVFSKDKLGNKELAGSSMLAKDNLGFFSHSQLGAFKGMADVLKMFCGKEHLGLVYNAKLGIKI